MKKLLLILLLASQSWATIVSCATLKGTTWGTSDTALANANFTIDTSVTLGAIFFPTGTTYTLTNTGTNVITLSNTGIAWKDSSSGAKTYPSSIIFYGASAQLVISSGAGTITGTSTELTFNGTTGCLLTDHKGATFKSLTGGASFVLTNSGGATTNFIGATSPFIITNGGTFTANRAINFTTTGAGALTNIGGSPTINGTATIGFYAGASSTAYTMPALTYTGSGAVLVYPATATTGSTITLSGNINTGTATFGFQTGNSATTTTMSAGGFSITCGALAIGCAGGSTASNTISFGTSVVSATTVTVSSLGAGATVNLETAFITASGNVTLAGTVNVGTSTFRFSGTSGTQAVTSAGKAFYDIVDSTMGATLSTSDALSCHSFTKRSTSTGPLTFAGDSVHCTGDMVLDAASSPALTFGRAIRFSGASSAAHFGSGFGTTNGLACKICFVGVTNPTFDDDKAIRFGHLCLTKLTHTGAAVSTFDSLTIAASGLYTTVDSQYVGIIWAGDSAGIVAASAKGFKISTFADIVGSHSKPVRFLSTSAGTRARLWFTTADTVEYSSWKDCSTSVLIKLDSSSRTLGNNRNVKSLSYWGGTVTPASGARGDTIQGASYGFIGGGAKIGDSVRTLTVTSYTAAKFTVPLLMDGGLKTVLFWNSDLDTLTKAAAFTVVVPSGRRRLGMGSFIFGLSIP